MAGEEEFMVVVLSFFLFKTVIKRLIVKRTVRREFAVQREKDSGEAHL
jgi:hypothetical protein